MIPVKDLKRGETVYACESGENRELVILVNPWYDETMRGWWCTARYSNGSTADNLEIDPATCLLLQKDDYPQYGPKLYRTPQYSGEATGSLEDVGLITDTKIGERFTAVSAVNWDDSAHPFEFRLYDPEEDRYHYEGSLESDGTPVSSWGKVKSEWEVQFWSGRVDKHGAKIYDKDWIRWNPSNILNASAQEHLEPLQVAYSPSVGAWVDGSGDYLYTKPSEEIELVKEEQNFQRSKS